MIRQNDIEEIIYLIYKGFSLNSLSFELDIPFELLQDYKKRLELREFARDSVKNGKTLKAIQRLNNYIQSTNLNIIERTILLKLNAYVNKTNIDEKTFQELEEERKKLGIRSSLDEILNRLKVQIPIEQQNENLQEDTKDIDYTEIIKNYKAEILSNPQQARDKRNLLAFTYFKAGMIGEAENELTSLIQETDSFISYRLLIHIEKSERNFEDAKLWAYEALDKFPNSIEIREQLISIAKLENDTDEIIKQLRNIISLDPKNKKSQKRLQAIINKDER